MKTLVSLILPFAAFMLAGAGAIGTKSVEANNGKTTAIMGYLHTTSEPCSEVSVNCQTSNNGQICEVSSKPVYRLTGANSCAQFLWKVNP